MKTNKQIFILSLISAICGSSAPIQAMEEFMRKMGITPTQRTAVPAIARSSEGPVIMAPRASAPVVAPAPQPQRFEGKKEQPQLSALLAKIQQAQESLATTKSDELENVREMVRGYIDLATPLTTTDDERGDLDLAQVLFMSALEDREQELQKQKIKPIEEQRAPWFEEMKKEKSAPRLAEPLAPAKLIAKPVAPIIPTVKPAAPAVPGALRSPTGEVGPAIVSEKALPRALTSPTGGVVVKSEALERHQGGSTSKFIANLLTLDREIAAKRFELEYLPRLMAVQKEVENILKQIEKEQNFSRIIALINEGSNKWDNIKMSEDEWQKLKTHIGSFPVWEDYTYNNVMTSSTVNEINQAIKEKRFKFFERIAAKITTFLTSTSGAGSQALLTEIEDLINAPENKDALFNRNFFMTQLLEAARMLVQLDSRNPLYGSREKLQANTTTALMACKQYINTSSDSLLRRKYIYEAYTVLEGLLARHIKAQKAQQK